jgi:hypothetical protein
VNRYRIAKPALKELVHAIRETGSCLKNPIALRRSDYAFAAEELNNVIDRADLLLE